MIQDGFSNTLLVGERKHFDPDFDKGPTMAPVMIRHFAAWAWAGGMKVSSNIFCSSAVNTINKDYFFWGGTSPGNLNAQDKRFNVWGSMHNGGVNFVFCDGSTRFISEDIPSQILTSITTRDKGEPYTYQN
jgi:prepilin-type processing-associated H-X9-DG protein